MCLKNVEDMYGGNSFTIVTHYSPYVLYITVHYQVTRDAHELTRDALIRKKCNIENVNLRMKK